MTIAEELLSKPEFSEYIKTHQSRAREIRLAAEQLADKTDSEKALRKLLPAISRNVINLFPETQRQVLSNMFAEWYKARNAEGTGSLDLALKNRDIPEIQSILRGFLPINQRFLEIAADRFSTMIAQSGI